ncbi:cyclic nucleotide-binding domain-containing protein [bacterium]|nr:cyclic nucleotide-binding domain-containing protein [bacterium]
MLSIVEKVLFLQDVDIFEYISTENLAYIAAIAEVVNFPEKTVIFSEGDASDSMYLIIEGRVRLEREGNEVMIAGERESFGVWAMFDDEPRVVTAIVVEECQALHISRDDFYDLLADNVLITQGIMKNIVRRLRKLMTALGR